MPEYLYGKRADGTVVSIYDISDEEYGKRCKCICPKCEREFQACALKSEKNVSRYFRHVAEDASRGSGNGNGCTAISANETGLHQMAKEIFLSEKKLSLPAVRISSSEVGLDLPDNILAKIPRFYQYQDSVIFTFDTVLLETPEGDFIPDAIALKSNSKLLVEFAVTHFVDKEKQERVCNNKVSMVEINLGEYVEKAIGREDLRLIIAEGTDKRTWIYYPRMEIAIEKAKEYFSSIPEVKKYLRKKNEQERQLRRKKEREEMQHKNWLLLQEPNNYNAALEKLRNDQSFYLKAVQQTPKDFIFYQKHRKIPFFIDIPITGEMVFKCDRRIWQGIIFNRYVYNRKDDGASFNIKNIYSDLKNTHEIPLDYDLPYYSIAKQVIDTYLEHLEFLGFISISPPSYYGEVWATVDARHTIIPPEKEHGEKLLEVLRKANRRSPDIDSFLQSELQVYKNAIATKRLKKIEQEREHLKQQKIEAERQKEEEEKLKKEAALKEKKRWEEEERNRIANSDFDQDDFPIYDSSGLRWMKCTVCTTVVQGFRIGKHESMNRGICKSCRVKQFK